ncbi:MAG: MFS transporter, partial [Bdellovibrionales bacterium]|nr:MFS transporter [Bdellovibrionales bacterium]
SPTESKSRRRFHYSALRELPKPFWAILAVSFALTLARFSEGFLILQAQEIGIGLALLPLVLVFMNISYAASSYQAGKLSDKLNRELVLAIGIFILIVADLIVAFSHSTGWFALGIALWGLHLGFTQGVISAIVADHTSKDILGTAFGFLNFSMGIATLFASAIAGFAWDISGPSSTFQLGALLSTLALLLLLIAYRQYASPLRPDESNT